MSNLSGNTCNPRTCRVCSHPERAEIESLILSISPDNPTLTLDAIALEYELSSEELRRHALMHTPLALDFSKESEDALVENFRKKAAGDASNQCASAPFDLDKNHTNLNSMKDRLSDKVGMRESDMLLSAATEYLSTMSALGRRIKRYASDNSEDSDRRLTTFCSNAIVNLYINCGSELRKAIQGIDELNKSINGGNDSASAGLQALAAALSSSNQAKKLTEDDEPSCFDAPQFLDPEVEDYTGD